MSQEDDAYDIAYVITFCHDELRNGEYVSVDNHLKRLSEIDLQHHITGVLTAWLRGSFDHRELLPHWKPMLLKVRSELDHRGLNSEWILRGLY